MVKRNDNLLNSCKHALFITWEDDQTDELLEEYIQSSIVYFSRFTHRELVVDTDSVVRELLIERVRYMYNNAVDEFEKNFSSSIASFIQEEAVSSFLESGETIEQNKRDGK